MKKRKSVSLSGLLLCLMMIVGLISGMSVSGRAADVAGAVVSVTNAEFYEDGSLKNLVVTYQASYDKTYTIGQGRIAVHSAPSAYSADKPVSTQTEWPTDAQLKEADPTLVSINDNGTFNWPSYTKKTATAHFAQGEVPTTEETTYYIYIWKKSSAAGIYPDYCLELPLTVKDGIVTCGSFTKGASHTHDGTGYDTVLTAAFAGGDLGISGYTTDVVLRDDITLNRSITIPDGAIVKLCLNGHVIDASGCSSQSAIITGTNAELQITDCNRSGETHYFTYYDIAAWDYLTDHTPASTDVLYTEMDPKKLTDGRTVIQVPGGVITGSRACAITNSGYLSLNGGTIVGNASDTDGGAFCNTDGTLRIGDGTICGNYGLCGGAVCNTGGTVAVSGNALITFNAAGYQGGGAIYCQKSTGRAVSLTISGGTISRNYTQGNGGGICSYSGTVTISGGTISGNNAYYAGGGIYNYGGTVNISAGSICENTANTGNGGGIFNAGTLTFAGGSIQQNLADCGGGIYHASGTTKLLRGTVSENRAKRYGGGVYVAASGVTTGGSVCVSGNTLTGTGTAENLYLPANMTVSSNAPNGASIGVTTAVTPTEQASVPVTGQNGGDYSSCFTSDNAQYKVVNEGNVVYLAFQHIHDWSYSVTRTTAEGDTISAVCNGSGTCSYTGTDRKVTVTAPAQRTYDGAPKAATLMNGTEETATLIGQELTIVYYKETGEQLATVPVNAGTYTAQVTAGNRTAGVTYTIEKAEPIVTAPVPKTLRYSGESQALVSAGSATGGQLQYAIGKDADTAPTDGWSTQLPTGTDAGTYYVWYSVVGDSNHRDVAAKALTVTIDQAEPIVTAPVPKTLTYSGEPQALVSAGSTTGGQLQYAIGKDADTAPTDGWSTQLPTGTDAGTYYVWYSVVGGTNYEDVAAKSLTVTMEKAPITPEVILGGWFYGDPAIHEPSVTGNPGNGRVTYSYKTLRDPEIAYSADQPTAPGVYLVRAEISETDNYLAGTACTAFTIRTNSQAAPESVSGQDETILGKGDGALTGLNPVTMEYRGPDAQADARYTAVTDDTMENLAPGTYQVRFRAVTGYEASDPVTITIGAGKPMTVQFDAQGGSSVEKITGLSWQQTLAEAGKEIPVTSRAGFGFEGWNTEADGTGETLAADTPIEAEIDSETGIPTVTYYAIWKTESVTVSFDAQGGTGVDARTVYVGDTLNQLPVTTRTGYTFLQWNTEPDGTGTMLTEETTFTEAVTFYAIWVYNYSSFCVAVDSTGNGTATADRTEAGYNQPVTITAVPEAGYEVGAVTVTGPVGQTVAVTDQGDGTYTFRMPAGDVAVRVTFRKTGSDEPDEPDEPEKEDYSTCPQDATCVYAHFSDADPRAWYHDGVHYCVRNGLMNGFSGTAFAPDENLSRAMLVTILWRNAGCPKTSYAMSFSDVASGTWYTEAVRWAQASGIVTGYDAATFGPADNVTREQLAVILYRYAASQGKDTAASAELSGYTDADIISAWATEAVQWATAVGIIHGRTASTIVPGGSATRAEAANMIQRFCIAVTEEK